MQIKTHTQNYWKLAHLILWISTQKWWHSSCKNSKRAPQLQRIECTCACQRAKENWNLFVCYINFTLNHIHFKWCKSKIPRHRLSGCFLFVLFECWKIDLISSFWMRVSVCQCVLFLKRRALINEKECQADKQCIMSWCSEVHIDFDWMDGDVGKFMLHGKLFKLPRYLECSVNERLLVNDYERPSEDRERTKESNYYRINSIRLSAITINSKQCHVGVSWFH